MGVGSRATSYLHSLGGQGGGVCSQLSSPPCLLPGATSGGGSGILQGSRGGSGVPWPIPPQESLSMLMRA